MSALPVLAAGAFAQTDAPEGNPPAKPAEPPAVIKRIENSRPVQATKRGLTKAGNAISRGAKRGEKAVRRAGDKVGEKLHGKS